MVKRGVVATCARPPGLFLSCRAHGCVSKVLGDLLSCHRYRVGNPYARRLLVIRLRSSNSVNVQGMHFRHVGIVGTSNEGKGAFSVTQSSISANGPRSNSDLILFIDD